MPRPQADFPDLTRPTRNSYLDPVTSPTNPTDDGRAPARSRMANFTNAILSGSATFIAIVALATGVYQAKLSRDQANAAVWPYLIQGHSGNGGYARIIQNVGVGPAKIRAFELRVDGHPMHSWQEMLDSLHLTLRQKEFRWTTVARGIVQPPGSTIDVIQITDSADARAMFAAAPRIDTWICYCSIYEQCWSATGADLEPKEVDKCVDDPARQFVIRAGKP